MNESAAYVPTKYDSVFWIDIEKIKPNPFQPRREFSEEGLKSLSESIRQYGVLQPLVVTRTEVEKPDGGLESIYELIAGERRLRASKMAGLKQLPVVIRTGESNLTKLELAIIENLQREDLNAIDRAKALQQLIEQFGISHAETAAKIGKSREYVSNSLRLLTLPDHMQQGVVNKEISEGHARALLALVDKPQEQETLFKEIKLKKLSVRAAESIARSIAQERVRAHHKKSPEMTELEKALTETLGTRVIIEPHAEGGRLLIDFFSPDDLSKLAAVLSHEASLRAASAQEAAIGSPEVGTTMPLHPNTTQLDPLPSDATPAVPAEVAPDPVPAAAPDEPKDDDIYAISNFTV
jgi:ParB family transcriptional regulator, chromosome partitioning protein